LPENDAPNPIFNPDAGAAIAGAAKKKKKIVNWSWETVHDEDAQAAHDFGLEAGLEAQQTHVSPWTQSITVLGGIGGPMPDSVPSVHPPTAEPEPPEYEDDDHYNGPDDPDNGPEEGEDEHQPSNEGHLMPPSPNKPGPKIVQSKTSADGSQRSCQTCGGTYPQAGMKQSADKVWLCGRCYPQRRKCDYCGWVVPEKKFMVKFYTHTYCEECGPKRKSKLNVKQQTTFEAKADVIRIRKEKVWPPTQ